uniref:C2H2-type domain-containing protein n=1 Tax=Amphilophus citrinellus TaxID=61819 RepID=A0A3Q0T2U3_AMPCI
SVSKAKAAPGEAGWPETYTCPHYRWPEAMLTCLYLCPTFWNRKCTIALEAPGNVVPAAITLQENAAEPPAPTQMVVNHIEQQQIVSVPSAQTVEPTILVSSIAESVTLSTSTSVISDCPTLGESNSDQELSSGTGPPTTRAEEATDGSQTFAKNFICNVCDKLFHSMKELSHHVGDHADEWPYKCEFCVLLFGKPSALLDHRSSLHGVGKTYVCSACTKEFVYLCSAVSTFFLQTGDPTSNLITLISVIFLLLFTNKIES